MQSAQRPSITVTLVGLRNPLSPPLPEQIVGRAPDVGRVRWEIDVQNKNDPMCTDFHQNRLHTNDDKGGAFLGHSFSATLQLLNCSARYILNSVDNLSEIRLTVKDRIFNGIPIFDLQEKNAANQALLLFQLADGYDSDHPEKYKNLSWLPDLVVVKHHQFYMLKQSAKPYQESYMERILNTLYFNHCNNENRLSSPRVSYVELLNTILPRWQDPNYAAYLDMATLLQAAFDNHPQNVSFYAYEAGDYGSDYVIFPRSQTLQLSPELVIHRFDMIDEIKATLFLQHQIILFIHKKLTELRDEDPIPRGILMDLQLFEKELFSEETLNNIDQSVSKKDLISLATKIASKFDSEQIALTRQFDELLKKRPQVLFNHLKIVMRRDMPIAAGIKHYLMLEQEFNANVKLKHRNEMFDQFEQTFQSIIENPDSEIEAFVSSIQGVKRRQKKDTVIRTIFNHMVSYFETISNLLNENVDDIGGASDTRQYNGIANVFFSLSELYLKICFLSAIVQIPRWLKNIRLQYDEETIPDQEAAKSDDPLCCEIKSIAFEVFSEENFNCRPFSRRLAEVIGVQKDVFFKLVAYMADYLYAECGEKITISIMRHFVEMSCDVIVPKSSQNLFDHTQKAIDRFFLAKLVDPVNNNTTYDTLVRLTEGAPASWPEIFSLLNVFISENFKEFNVVSFSDDLSKLVQFCNDSVQNYARNNGNLQENQERIQGVEQWAKGIITMNNYPDDIPSLLKVLVVQAILLAYQRKRELGAEGIFTLALSYLEQKPKNIYMACQMFNHLFSAYDALYRALKQEQIEVIIEALDRCEAEGFVSQRMLLEKINKVIGINAVDQNRRTIVSNRLLNKLASYLAEANEKALATTARSPVKPSGSGGKVLSVDNLFSLNRISKNKGLEIIAFSALELLFNILPPNSGLYNYIFDNAENIFPALYREFSIAGANSWCLYAMVIAYLVKQNKSLDSEKTIINSIYPQTGEINTHWSDFFDGRSRDNIALSYRALVALEMSYQDLERENGASPVGRQAIDMLINAMMLKEFSQEYFALLSMMKVVTQADALRMMKFLVERKNNFIPFAIKAEKVGCFVIDKATRRMSSAISENFDTFFQLVNQCQAIDDFSVLVILINSQNDPLSVDQRKIVGLENPDLFDFAWYLKHNQKQAALAEAIMAFGVPKNDDPNLTEIFNVLQVNAEHNPKVKQQLCKMIEDNPVKLINKSPEHLQLAWFLYCYYSLPMQGSSKEYFPYFIAQPSEILVALFFINEIVSCQKQNKKFQDLMFSLSLTHRNLTLTVVHGHFLFLENSSEDLKAIKTEIEDIVNKNVDHQISSVISYFGQNSSPPATPHRENEETKNGCK